MATARQIAGYASNAGFSGDALVTAVAVALAESSGRTDVVNSIGCVGLWQINQPVHVKSHPAWTRAYLQNPANNARAAYALSNGGKNWVPWEAYTNGSYRLHLRVARDASGSPQSTGTGTVTTSPVSAVSGAGASLIPLVTLAQNLTDGNTWKRIAYFIAGAALLIYALAKITHADVVLKKTAKEAASIALTKGAIK